VSLTVVVPTFNEGPNVAELVRRLAAVLPADASILFVDDSKDDTPAIIERVAAESAGTTSAAGSPIRVQMIHRDAPDGGLSGAVVEGLRAAEAQGSDWVVVMDGDLQHPPEMVPQLVARGIGESADVVVASRYVGAGDAGGLDGKMRHLVSRASGTLARSMFPVRLRAVTDPMTGFFAVRTSAVDVDQLQPRGFKILLEILARTKLTVIEEPFTFGERFAGESKATFANGVRYLQQLWALRFGRLSPFAVIGASGAVLNLVILEVLGLFDVHYLPAAIVANALTIISNFLLQERFVFRDLRFGSVWRRFAQSFTFNGTEAIVRTVLLWLIVDKAGFDHATITQAVLIFIAFIVRFVFHAQVVYRPGRNSGGFDGAQPKG
jgi:dolichol-phosphate mannosyltransferase